MRQRTPTGPIYSHLLPCSLGQIQMNHTASESVQDYNAQTYEGKSIMLLNLKRPRLNHQLCVLRSTFCLKSYHKSCVMFHITQENVWDEITAFNVNYSQLHIWSTAQSAISPYSCGKQRGKYLVASQGSRDCEKEMGHNNIAHLSNNNRKKIA